MYPSLKPSQRAAIVGAINPQSSSATLTTGWVDASLFCNFLAIVGVGALGTAATVDAKIQQAQDNTGTGVKDVTGKAITQLLKATPDDNKQVLINVKSEELDSNNGFGWLRLSMTQGTAASVVFGQLLGLDPHYAPANTQAAASQAQVVG